jgi:hypothetical protein
MARPPRAASRLGARAQRAASAENPCGASRNAFANLLAKVWYPTMNVSSTTSASEKCSRKRARHPSET